MTYKETYYLVGQCLGEAPECRTAFEEKVASGSINWTKLVKIGSDHLVLPALYLQLKKQNLLPLVPEDLALELELIWEANRVRNFRILFQVKHLAAVLHPQMIYPLLLKGTANLVDGLYSDLGERMIHDIDLLVTEEQFLHTAQLLQQDGYQFSQLSFVDPYTMKHYPCLFKPEEPVVVEIHRLPVPARYAQSFSPLLLFSGQKPVAHNPGLFVPSDTHKLIHTFLHDELADQGNRYKQSTLRGFYDLLLLSRRVEVSSLAEWSAYPDKAVAWLSFAQRVLGLPGRFYPTDSRSARWYAFRYDLALAHGRSYEGYSFLRKQADQLARMTRSLWKALLHKKHRKALFQRLKAG